MTVAQWTDPAFIGLPEAEGTILRIERFAIHDGPGIRSTVFLKGCPLRCSWCHSPESQSPAPEFMPLAERCVRCGACTDACPEHAVRPAADGGEVTPAPCTLCGDCAAACPSGARELVGHRMSVGSLLAALERDRIFYDESGGGVTFSGGEPLMQADFLLEAVHACHESGLHVAVDTCGMGETHALLEAAWSTDLFLFDIKMLDEERHTAYTGVSNTLILHNLEQLASVHRQVLVRFPLVPGVNDDDDNVRAIGAFLASLRLTRIDVLPYHRAGLAKYHRLQRPYGLSDTQPPTPASRARVARLLEGCGLIVGSGGLS